MAEATFSLDLHVLGPPLTFALSQDQTLHRKVLNPALRRLLETHPGGRSRPTWNGFYLRQKLTIIFRNRLAIQFSETDPDGEAVASRRSRWPGAVEGCCLYGISF